MSMDLLYLIWMRNQILETESLTYGAIDKTRKVSAMTLMLFMTIITAKFQSAPLSIDGGAHTYDSESFQ